MELVHLKFKKTNLALVSLEVMIEYIIGFSKVKIITRDSVRFSSKKID